MKTLIIYYSYTEKTKKLAEALAKTEGADIIEVKYQKRPSKVCAYVKGSFAARKQKQADLQPFQADFAAYDKIIIAAPVWAQYPAPAFNNIMAALPGGKKVEIIMTSGSGNSGNTRKLAEAALVEKGCELIGFKDIKAAEIT